MWPEIIIGLIGLVTTVLSSVVTWLLSRPKEKADIHTQLIEDMQKALDFYKSLAESNKEELSVILQQNEELIATKVQLQTDIDRLKEELLEVTKGG